MASLRKEFHRKGARAPLNEPEPADEAVSPGQIGPRGWWMLLARTLRHVLAARLPLLCAGTAFFAVLSIAPVLVTALSAYGAVNTPAQALDQLSKVAESLPAQLRPLVTDQLTNIATTSTEVLTVRGLTALVIAMWTATTAMTSLIDTLTVAYHETETRGFVQRSVLALTFVLGGALLLGGVIALASIASRTFGGAPEPARTVLHVITWLTLATLMSASLAVLYRFGPDRKNARWRWITLGAMGATALWLATSVALFAYVQRLGTYGTIYGSLAGVAISMFWLWITVLLIVVGAAVNGESERQTVRDSTVGAERPLGDRGAVVADTAPPFPDDA